MCMPLVFLTLIMTGRLLAVGLTLICRDRILFRPARLSGLLVFQSFAFSVFQVISYPAPLIIPYASAP